MSVLLNAPPSEEVSEEMTTQLLYRIAEVQRAFARDCVEKPLLCPPPPPTIRAKVVRRRHIGVSRRPRRRFSE